MQVYSDPILIIKLMLDFCCFLVSMFCSIFSIDDQHKNDAFLENVVATNSMVPVSLTINECLFPIIHRKCTHVSVERDILHFVWLSFHRLALCWWSQSSATTNWRPTLSTYRFMLCAMCQLLPVPMTLCN